MAHSEREAFQEKALRDNTLSHGARLLYLQLDFLAKDTTGAHITRPAMAALMNRSEQMITKYLKELTLTGYVKQMEADCYELGWITQLRKLALAENLAKGAQ